LSFITPDKWISKDFGIELRKRVAPGLVSILPVGRGVFESTLIDSIITTISAQPVPTLQLLSLNEGRVSVTAEINKTELNADDGFDQWLSPSYMALRKLDVVAVRRLGDLAQTENACATSDAYVLKSLLVDAGTVRGYDSRNQYKVVNTGTLGKFAFRWGERPMRYLKDDYLFPVVSKTAFEANFGATYRRRAASPKIIIKGLTLLDAALDHDGSFVPGKTTLVVCSDDTSLLKFLLGVINSRVASLYVTSKYASASYNGGVNFTPDMLNSIPIPDSIDEAAIISSVDEMIAAQSSIQAATLTLYALIRASSTGSGLRRALERWYDLSNGRFLEELERQGLDLSVRRRAEWVDILQDTKAQIAGARAQLVEGREAVEARLCEAYGFDPADVVPQHDAVEPADVASAA
jgi:hypothetical protein